MREINVSQETEMKEKELEITKGKGKQKTSKKLVCEKSDRN